MPDTAPPLDAKAARELLQESAIVLSSFRNLLRINGYPFREPPEAKRIIAEIDALLDPDLTKAPRKSAAVAAAEGSAR